MTETPTKRFRWRGCLTLLGFLAFGLVVGSLVLLYLSGDYVESRSGYCSSCHEEQSHTEVERGRGDVACQACHLAPTEGRLAALLPLVNSSVEMPDHGGTIAGSCLECHQDNERLWQNLMVTPGHSAHAVDPGDEGCVYCHGESLHGARKEVSCMECHGDVPLFYAEGETEINCTECHSFALHATATPTGPGTTDEPGHPRVTIEEVHGAADCRFCHNPHDEPQHHVADCRRCHRGAIASSADRLPEEHQDCQSCHLVHAPRTERAIPCQSCHQRPRVRREGEEEIEAATEEGDEEPRPPEAFEELAVVRPTESLPSPETLSHEGDCATCHHPHAEGPWIDSCQDCHEEQGLALELLSEGSHEECITCHEPHSEPADASICGTCHGLEASSLTRARGEHRNCLSCHRAHEGRPRHTAVCAPCHGVQNRRMAAGPVEHRRCESCHVEHDHPSSGSLARCGTCHEDEARAARRSRETQHRHCDSCHADHSFTRATATSRCGTCHEDQTLADAAHRDECIKCHAAHGPTRPEAVSCTRCHEEIRPTIREHERCQDCHRSHRPGREATCWQCHEDQHRLTRTWPADSPHNGSCRDCHPPHGEDNRVGCETCHAEQAATTHMGTHRLCESCHRPHRSRPIGTRGWWGRCGDCHQAERLASSRSSRTHRECTSCHDNPGLESPPCASCHEATVSEMLHTHREHGTCRDCHPSHSTALPDRRSCLRCHTDRRLHYPDAARCQGCHPFTASRGGARARVRR